jgi:hypothetical protein
LSNIWTTPSVEDDGSFYPTPKPEHIPFDSENYPPLTFIAAEKVSFAVSRSRQLLSKRTNSDCMKIATSIARMSFIIESIERQRSISLIKQDSFEQVWLLKGRALFLWMENFDISGLGVEKIEWFEVFAVRALMLCVQYTKAKAMQVETNNSALKVVAIEVANYKAEEQIVEIVDCLARSEVLEKHGRVNTSAKLLGSKGGKGRTLKQAPLENEIFRLYLASYQQMPVLTAANCIAVIIEETKPDLLQLTKNKSKPIAIQNIILKLKDGRARIIIES